MLCSYAGSGQIATLFRHRLFSDSDSVRIQALLRLKLSEADQRLAPCKTLRSSEHRSARAQTLFRTTALLRLRLCSDSGATRTAACTYNTALCGKNTTLCCYKTALCSYSTALCSSNTALRSCNTALRSYDAAPAFAQPPAQL